MVVCLELVAGHATAVVAAIGVGAVESPGEACAQCFAIGALVDVCDVWWQVIIRGWPSTCSQ